MSDESESRKVWRELLAGGGTTGTYAHARRILGLTVIELSAVLELPAWDVERWEAGHDMPSRRSQLALAALLTPGALNLAQRYRQGGVSA